MVKTLVAILFAAAVITGLIYWLRKIWFYRDPSRIPPEGEGLILAPADGKVVYVKPFVNSEVIAEKLGTRIPLQEITKVAADNGERGWVVGIYMSPLDVHFNYAPLAGVVTKVFRSPAAVNLPMVDLWEYIRLTYLRQAVDLFTHRYRLVNERLTICINGKGIRLAMVEIADKFVNKIEGYVQQGQRVQTGQKVSFIHRGSQVDLVIFSEEVEILVPVGQQVYGAQTVVARYRPVEG